MQCVYNKTKYETALLDSGKYTLIVRPGNINGFNDSSKWYYFDVGLYSVDFYTDTTSEIFDSQTKRYEENLLISDKTPKKDGFNFVNWNTEADGSGTTYESGAIYSDNADLKLYAQWEKTQYTIQYNLNGGEGSISSSTYADGTTGKISSVIPKRDGYKFIGWSDNQTAAEAKYQPNDNYTENKDVTLYAVWKVIPSTKTTVTKKSSYSLLDIAVNNTPIGTNLIIAAYLNGRLVDYQNEEYIDEDITVAVSTKFDLVKVMLWKDLNSMQPLCSPEVIK